MRKKSDFPLLTLALDAGGCGAAGRAAVLARSQRACLRLSVVKCKSPGGEGVEGAMSAALSLALRSPPSLAESSR